ncbi:beta-1,3-galactosyltransferase 5 [Amyelois transitella]|uniref:beta-1,3-galactosyltransferase 5 n=1 Tax=Amyelois transitella TaxID=680683 RepID=UPI00067B137C|nr:beta-1,3-galactosyltransferase 5 [Amyelois transitella]XP_060807806.1 beta-1,3-galactosyltransferase 5 [Amyelois transitella]
MVRPPNPATMVTATGLLLMLWIISIPQPSARTPHPLLHRTTFIPTNYSKFPISKGTKIVISSTKADDSLTTANKSSEILILSDIYESDDEKSYSELCPLLGSKLQVLILVTSAPSHVAPRNAIRMTWGHYATRSNISLAFVIGTPPDSLKALVEDEDLLYGDIIIGDFVDSYSNLTLKSIFMLEWVNKHCPLATRILKTDDDMFINVPKLIDFMENPLRLKMTKTIWGKVMKKSLPKRSSRSKYYVPNNEFPGKVYPDFTTGPAYLMTADVIEDLLDASNTEPYVRLEDVYITGILAEKLGIKRQHATEFYNKKIKDTCMIKRGISVHMVKYHEQFDLWKKLQDGMTKCTK